MNHGISSTYQLGVACQVRAFLPQSGKLLYARALGEAMGAGMAFWKMDEHG
jgi:hypothetical protein